MNDKEQILKILGNFIKSVEKNGAKSIFLSVNYGEKSGNAFYGSVIDLATSLAAQGDDIEKSTIPDICKAIEVAKIMF